MKPRCKAMALVFTIGVCTAPSIGSTQTRAVEASNGNQKTVLFLLTALPGESASRLEERLVRELQLILENHALQVVRLPEPYSNGQPSAVFKDRISPIAQEYGAQLAIWIRTSADSRAEVHLLEIETEHHETRSFEFDGNTEVAGEMALAVNELLIAGLDGDGSAPLPSHGQSPKNPSGPYGDDERVGKRAPPDPLDRLFGNCWGIGALVHGGRHTSVGSPDPYWQIGIGLLGQWLFEDHVAMTGLLNGAYVPEQTLGGRKMSGSWWELGAELQPSWALGSNLIGPILGLYGHWLGNRGDSLTKGWSLKLTTGLGASLPVSSFSVLVLKSTVGILGGEALTPEGSGRIKEARTSHVEWGVFWGFIQYFTL